MSRKLTPSERNAIRRALENCDDAVESVQTDYSGRFMYGQECFGIVTSDPFRLVGSWDGRLRRPRNRPLLQHLHRQHGTK